MKLCVISHSYLMQPGYLPVLQSMASLPGVELALVTPDEYSGCIYTAERFAELHSSVQVFPIPIRFGGRQGTFIYRQKELHEAIESFRPDMLLHDQEVYTLGAWQIAAVARRRSIPLAMFVWENVARKLSWPRRRLSRFVMERCSGLIAGSSGAEKVHSDWGYRGPIQVIPQMGVTAVDAQPCFGRRDPDLFQIAYAGRLVPEKGVDCLLRAVARLHARKFPIHCTIMGDGPECSHLVKLANSLGIRGVITIAGPKPLLEVARQLGSSDVLVLPSRRTKTWEEQFGRILVEAMARATVTVGSRTGAIPEVIGSAHLTFDDGDDEMLADLLKELLTDHTLLEKQQRSLLRRVEEHYLNDVLSKRRIEFVTGLCYARPSVP